MLKACLLAKNPSCNICKKGHSQGPSKVNLIQNTQLPAPLFWNHGLKPIWGILPSLSPTL